jgi:cysteine desulfurase
VNSDRIYLDYAATTPLRAEVAEAMRASLPNSNYNPSSLHAEGRRARASLDNARSQIASLLGASRNEVVFTGGGTESDNLAIMGAARASGRPARIVATAIEHHAVLGALEVLEDDGFETALIPVDARGHVDRGAFEAALTPGTLLASVAYANNEIGTVAPIAALAAVAHARGVFLHTDAVQAPSWLPLDVGALGADLLSLSGHKFGGPKGVGVLYVRSGTPLAPITGGGGQEFGRRSGTQNVAGIVGLARALELAVAEREAAASRIGALRDRLQAGMLEAVPDVTINGGEPRLPNLLHVTLAGVSGDELLIGLDLAGVAVSAGSACTSGSPEPSHVLAALAGGRAHAGGGIRLSLGISTTSTEVDRVLALLPGVVARLRRPAGARRGDA